MSRHGLLKSSLVAQLIWIVHATWLAAEPLRRRLGYRRHLSLF
jgi:hypothetical protein